jgi:hypothetical protein
VAVHRACLSRKAGGLANVLSVENKPLDPERQARYEVGATYPRSPALAAAVTAFHADIRNAKQPVAYARSGLVFIALFDQTDVVRSGAEVAVNGVLDHGLGATRYRFGWTYLAQTDDAIDNGRTAPRNVGNLWLQHVAGPRDATLGPGYVSTFQSNFQSIDGRFQPIGAYTRVDLGLGRTFRAGATQVRVAAYGRNVTNRRYETQLGFPDPGAVWGLEAVIEYREEEAWGSHLHRKRSGCGSVAPCRSCWRGRSPGS